jgi:hypothetical protein
MKFTFGIVTGTKVDERVLNSIYDLNVPEFEIIIVGGESPIGYPKLKHIPFDETQQQNWITKKKNIITEHATYDNIVFIHDYIVFDKDWYNQFKKFGDNFDICMNVIKNLDGSRFRDWCTWDDPDINYPHKGGRSSQLNNHTIVLPPYDYNKKQYMYISGSYWIAKKYVMQNEPLDESLVWGEGEDLEWSKRVLSKYNYKMNIHSSVQLLKDKRLSGIYLEN